MLSHTETQHLIWHHGCVNSRLPLQLFFMGSIRVTSTIWSFLLKNGMTLKTLLNYLSHLRMHIHGIAAKLVFCLLTFGRKAVRSSCYDSSPYVPVPIVYTFLPLPKEESNTFKTWQWSLPIILFTQFKRYKPPLFACERPALSVSASLYTCHM